MSNCNETLESEKMMLSLLVEKSFYSQDAPYISKPFQLDDEITAFLQVIQRSPVLYKQLVQLLLLSAAQAQQNIV